MLAVRADLTIFKISIGTETKDKATVGILCSHNYGLTPDIADGHIEHIRAEETSPLSHDYICDKGFSVDRYVNHGQRLRHPPKRKPDGGFERISWDHAISVIAF